MEPCTLQWALQRHFVRTIGITNMLLVCFIPRQAQRVQLLFSVMVSDFHSECKNKDFSLEAFPLLTLVVPSNGIQERENVSECRRKNILTYNLLFSETAVCCWSKISGESKWPPCFGTSATVYSQLLATGAMGDIPSRRNHEMALKWSLSIWSQITQWGKSLPPGA